MGRVSCCTTHCPWTTNPPSISHGIGLHYTMHEAWGFITFVHPMGHEVCIPISSLYNPLFMGKVSPTSVVQPITLGQLISHPSWVVWWPHSPWVMDCTTCCTMFIHDWWQNVTVGWPMTCGKKVAKGVLGLGLLYIPIPTKNSTVHLSWLEKQTNSSLIVFPSLIISWWNKYKERCT